MILNVSGRTDIVAFYTPWFIKRIEEGYFDVRNPFNPKLVSRIYLNDVDLIVFCTKNPIPILKYLPNIDKPILFHITLTPYKEDIEVNVIPKGKVIEAIKEVSKIIGAYNVYVRYDPIFINEKYTIEYHKRSFKKLCSLLDGYTNSIIISFLDNYKNVRKNYDVINPKVLSEEDMKSLLASFIESANMHNMSVQTCMEDIHFENNLKKDVCLSKELAYKLTGKKFRKWQARNCGCIEMVDIGAYNTCNHLCKYCYANYDSLSINNNIKNHDVNSSLLIGHLEKDDVIKVRKSF